MILYNKILTIFANEYYINMATTASLELINPYAKFRLNDDLLMKKSLIS